MSYPNRTTPPAPTSFWTPGRVWLAVLLSPLLCLFSPVALPVAIAAGVAFVLLLLVGVKPKSGSKKRRR